MIHNSSSDPVLIKKINLQIWSLRDEIEARLLEKVNATPDSEINIEDFRGQFIKDGVTSNNVVPLKSGEVLDNSEDEIARAMRGEEISDTPADALATPAQPVANSNIINITFAPPEIPEDRIFKGKTVLAEISMEKMFFFCNKGFTEGQSIVIRFCIPKMFLINADVLYCRPHNLKSRIISKNNYNYRVLIKFTFLKEGERALLRQFIQSIEPDLSKFDKKQKSTNSKDDDLSALKDLGL